MISKGRVQKNIYRKFHTRGGGVSKGHFPYPFSKKFLLQMVEISFLDIEVFSWTLREGLKKSDIYHFGF